MTTVQLRGVQKRFGDHVALQDFSLDVASGELLALLGPSGCGKTTLLRIIAGLEHADAGAVWLGGVEATRLPVQQRRVGFVFQNYALFRHLSVAENIAFGLRVRPRGERPPEAKIQARVDELLGLMQLGFAKDRFPAQLSGGQRQRVALARALAIDPAVLLLDEPFGALDTQVRTDLRRWLRTLHDELHVTSLLVTHDQHEALEVADRVVVMNRGHLEQVGEPQSVYEEPASAFVHSFLGEAQVFGLETRGDAVHAGPWRLAGGSVPAGATRVLVRPHDVEFVSAPDSVSLEVLQVRQVGPSARVTLRPRGTQGPALVEAQLDHAHAVTLALEPGREVPVRLRHWKAYAD
jgi:sulfate/thiosulfate transport system ATP-binding protein